MKISKYLFIIILCFHIPNCSSLIITAEQDEYLCIAFENDSKEMLENYFVHWENEIKPITTEEKLELNDTVKIIYQIFEDFENYHIDKHSSSNLKKPYSMIQNEIKYSIADSKFISNMLDSKIELLSLLTPINIEYITPPSLVKDEAFLISQIKYPELARRAAVDGISILEFIVDTLGSTKNYKLLKTIGAGCDEAVIEAIRNIKFIPAKMKGISVEQKMKISIKFSIPITNQNQYTIIKTGIINNFRPFPNKLMSKPVYVTASKNNSLINFIRSDCGMNSEKKYKELYWHSWPRTNFIEQMADLSARMINFHYHLIPHIRIKFNKYLDRAIISSSTGSSFIDYFFEMVNGKWEYIETIRMAVE